jgi:multidrug transporter EmrE-like cation transporter
MFCVLMAATGWIRFSEKRSILQGLGLALTLVGVMPVALPC